MKLGEFMNSFEKAPDEGYIRVYFAPQPDITALELAEMVSRMTFGAPPRFGALMRQIDFDAMPPSHRRHWSTTEPKD